VSAIIPAAAVEELRTLAAVEVDDEWHGAAAYDDLASATVRALDAAGPSPEQVARARWSSWSHLRYRGGDW
jgi:hypothetical protein